MFSQPRHQRIRIPVTRPTGAERVDSQLDIFDPRGGWIVQDDDVDLVTAARNFTAESKYGTRNAADARIERVNQLQNLQWARQRNLPSAENICCRVEALL